MSKTKAVSTISREVGTPVLTRFWRAKMDSIYGQMSIFDFLAPEKKPEKPRKILSVGDKIGKVVLGECYVATITEVEGLPNHPFYRTDAGICYYPENGEKSVEELERIAEKERLKYKTIIPRGLSEKITVEYEPRESGERVLWAQIGIIGNMLFWKENITYQFLEPYDSEKKLRKEYEKHKKRMLEDTYSKYEILEEEKPMERLYWSRHGFYAMAEYVETNG